MKCKVVKGNKENLKELCDLLGARSKMDLGPIIETVSGVIDDIKENGDNAVLKYTEKFDKAVLTADTMRVTSAEIDEAIKSIDPELLSIIRKAAANIRAFHEKQKEEGFMMDTAKGSKIGVRVRPISVAGIYVPGGTASYPSSVLMNVIPAKVAGVPDIVMCTPPGRDGRIAATTLVAAREAGVGTIATGVAKGGAGKILISGSNGGTGAAPRDSIYHAGLPLELGLAEAQQTLLSNGLRSRVVLEADGKLITYAGQHLLSSEEFMCNYYGDYLKSHPDEKQTIEDGLRMFKSNGSSASLKKYGFPDDPKMQKEIIPYHYQHQQEV